MAKLFVCGDVMNPLRSLDFVGDRLSDVIRTADYAVCNFEGPELKEGQTANCPHQKPGTAAYLKSVGFDLMLLANNHITELGAEGLKYSIDTISSCGADCIGAGLSWDEAYRPLVCLINGIKFGFINICEAQNGYFYSTKQSYGYAWMGYNELFDDVRKLSSLTDKVVVFVHAGLEHYQIPLPQYRSFYKKICDNGASCVIGSHPHCAQGYEYYGNKLIAYSIGNFFFPRANNAWVEENKSYSLMLDFNEDGSIVASPIIHALNKGVVELRDTRVENNINIEKLNNLLTENYDSNIIEMCVNDYYKNIEKRLAYCFCGEYEGIKMVDRIKNVIRTFLFRKKFVTTTKQDRIKSLLPLFENESRRYSIIVALKNIKENECN